MDDLATESIQKTVIEVRLLFLKNVQQEKCCGLAADFGAFLATADGKPLPAE
jgi:hypothetical protein